MDFLWSPWRAGYVEGLAPETGCVFCRLASDADAKTDEARHVLYRGKASFVVLNLYPYTSGHLLIAPYAHLALIADAEKPVTDELMDLAKKAQLAIAAEYRPDGFNLGMNLGQAAGAGVADHFHMHLLPRWIGDTNFASTVGETRVLPESLSDTYRKLKRHF
jgi:ATP adenylyltransferase